VVFVLDTTGSMGGLISAAKQRIWSIANAIASARPRPDIRLGLIAYRDRQDAYVTRRTPLTADLDALYASLMQLEAGGGGDGPESVNQALHEAVTRFGWSSDPSTLRLVYLVGDAPPHMDYAGDVPYPKSCHLARDAGIVVSAVQCGDDRKTEEIWREIASLGGGAYLAISGGGQVRAMTTPWDEQLSLHSSLLDRTLIPYGEKDERRELERKIERAREIDDEAPAEALADRATFKAGAGGRSFAGGGELTEDVASGKVKLSDIPDAQLPPRLREMSPEARERHVRDMVARRRGLMEEIDWLSQRRREYLESRGGTDRDDFDRKIASSLRCEGERVGLRFEDEEDR
jgi:hypothetical protein